MYGPTRKEVDSPKRVDADPDPGVLVGSGPGLNIKVQNSSNNQTFILLFIEQNNNKVLIDQLY